MPITFGAVGDIISVCLLVKDLVQALDKARGSRAEYQSAIRELWILDRILLEIDLLSRVHGNGVTPALQGLCVTAKEAVDRCKGLVSSFLQRVRRYQNVLGEGKTPNVLHEAAVKVRWRIGEKDALEQFRTEIAGTSSSLQMLLATASVTLLDVSRKEIKGKLERCEDQNKLASSSQHNLLRDIQERLEVANEGIEAGNSILGKVTDALRLDWLRQLGIELKGLLTRSIAINVATYQAIINHQASLPSRLERGLIEEPVILEDAIGRVAPVHLQFVTSWDAFNAILEIRFRGIQGHRKIAQGQYGLQDRATGKEVDHSREWQRAFLPGQPIVMSMVFHREEMANSDHDQVTCPGCHTPATKPVDSDIQCSHCLIWYRRITVVEESNTAAARSTQRQSPNQALTTSRKRRNSQGKRGVADELDEEDDEEDVREFKRVRIMSTPRRKTLGAFDSTGQSSVLGAEPRLKAFLWEDESTVCFQVEKKGVIVARREDDNTINGTRLLALANVSRARRDQLRIPEQASHITKIGPLYLRGVWIPFERALELANQEGITELVYPLFVHDIVSVLYHPVNKVTSQHTSQTDSWPDMPIPRAREDVPPPSPPPRHIEHLRNGQYPDWHRKADPHTLREPPVPGPLHMSWEEAWEESDVMSTAAEGSSGAEHEYLQDTIKTTPSLYLHRQPGRYKLEREITFVGWRRSNS